MNTNSIRFSTATLLCFVFWASSIYAQRTVSKVIDKKSGEGIVGALMQVNENQVLVTDEFGQSIASFEFGTNTVRISYLGYLTLDTTVNITSDTVLMFSLLLDNDLPTIIVTDPGLNQTEVHSSLNRIAPSIESLRSRPALGGEVDYLKALQLQSGIAGGADGTADLYVRGGTPDQNLILLDGAKVYNSNHLFGLLSPFQPSLVKSIEVFKGGFPARYGGRLSSVVSVASIDGNTENWNAEASVGLVNAHFSTNGPLNKNTSLALGGRTAYLAILNLLIQQGNSFQTYSFYDLNAKLTHRTERSNISISAFTNRDRSVLKDEFLRSPSQGLIRYGNTTFGTRWLYQLANNANVFTEATLNRYRFSTTESIESVEGLALDDINTKSTIQEITGRVELRATPGQRIKITAGVEANNRVIAPRTTSGSLTQTSVDLPQENSFDVGLYVEPVISLSKSTKIRTGLRYQTYWLPTAAKSIGFVEPRLAINSQITPKWQLSASYARMSQGIHRITSNFVGIPNNLWVSARNEAGPGTSNVWTIGTANKINDKVVIAGEIFYKTLNDVIDPLPGRNLFQNTALDWLNTVSTGGEANVYGLETSASLNRNKWNAAVAYTLSWNRIRYEEVNDGDWYFRQFDRRHDLSLTGSYNLSDKWKVHGNFVINSGYRLTLPKTVYFDGIFNTVVSYYRGRYQEQSPIYHRADLNFVREVIHGANKFRRLSLGVYNLYARANPSFILEESEVGFEPSTGRPAGPINISTKISQTTLFRFIPHISYTWGF